MGFAVYSDTLSTYSFSAPSVYTSGSLRLVPELAHLNEHALPRAAQLEEIGRLSIIGRRRVSRLERARFGWNDAPRRPCYRGARSR